MQQVRPSTVQSSDQHSRRISLYPENQLVPLRTRYDLTSHPELPGWRSPVAAPSSSFRVTATRPTAFTTRKNLPQVPVSPRLPPSLSVPSLRNQRPATFTVVSPREVVLPVQPVPLEVRIPTDCAWVQRNRSTVPRLHMHLERLDGGLPPLTAPPPSVLPVPLLAEVEESVSSTLRTPVSPSAEASIIYARSQSSATVEDCLHTHIHPPLRISMPDTAKEREPAQLTTIYTIRERFAEELEWVQKEAYQRVGIVRARTQIYRTKRLGEEEEEQGRERERQLETILLETIQEVKELGEKETAEVQMTLSQELSVIPPDSARVPTSPNSLPEDPSEKLTLFREIFEGRPSTRSHTFTPGSSDNEHKSLFDVFMLELKRGFIKSREQALSFIKDELKDSMVSDIGGLNVSRQTPSESTRPSYVLWGTETVAESESFFAFRRRERNRSVGQRQVEEAGETSPRLIRSSELKLRPRFADLSRVVLEYPEFGPPPTRGINEQSPLVEVPEAEQTLDIGGEEGEKTEDRTETKAVVRTKEEKKETPATDRSVKPTALKRRDITVVVTKPGGEPKSSVQESPTPKARKGTSFKRSPASLPKSKAGKASRSKAEVKAEVTLVRSSSDAPAVPASLPVISPFEIAPAEDISLPSAELPDASPRSLPPQLFPRPQLTLRRLSASLVPPSVGPTDQSSLPSEAPLLTTESSDTSPREQGVRTQPVTWRHLFLREEAQIKQSSAKEEPAVVKKVYDIRSADALDQFTVNMAISLVTSLALLFKHRSKGELESIKMRAVLDERRTLQKLAKFRGTRDRKAKLPSEGIEKPEKQQEHSLQEPSEKPIDIPIPTNVPSVLTPIVTSSLSPKSPVPSSASSPVSMLKPLRIEVPKPESKAKTKRSRRASKRDESPDGKPEVDRNYVYSNIDFELRQIEMMRKLAAGMEDEGEKQEQDRPQGEAERPGSEEEARGEDKPWKNCREEWEKGVLAEAQKSEVEELLLLMMKDKTLRDLLPFSTCITYSFAQTLDSATTLHDFTPLNPAVEPDLALQQELALRAAFLQFCSHSLKYADFASTQTGVLFQAHKDSYLPTELRKEVREAVKKRRYREKVAQERTQHRHVALRAKAYTTFSGLPNTATVHSARPVSQHLLVDGFAHRVKSDLERKERVYLRMKKEENLRKLSLGQGRWSEASLQAGLKNLNSLFRPQTRG